MTRSIKKVFFFNFCSPLHRPCVCVCVCVCLKRVTIMRSGRLGERKPRAYVTYVHACMRVCVCVSVCMYVCVCVRRT